MKQTFKMIAAIAGFICMCTSASAQREHSEGWKEKMMSEKIAFITMELNLTPEEAQIFWPVYNEVEKEKDQAMEAVIKAYKELDKALEEEKGEKKIAALLEAYVSAQDDLRDVEENIIDKYKTVLSDEKVAKLLVAEEKFRRQHIRKLHGGDGKHGHKPGPPDCLRK